MERIASFSVNHLNLEKGLYVSRRDEKNGVVVTTFDLRMTQPNVDEAMNGAAVHTMEHIGATFLRNHEGKKQDIIYFGPMGCLTGFYLVMFGDLSSKEILPLVKEMTKEIKDWEGEIPGESAIECGNYKFMDLAKAKEYAQTYYKVLENITDKQLEY